MCGPPLILDDDLQPVCAKLGCTSPTEVVHEWPCAAVTVKDAAMLHQKFCDIDKDGSGSGYTLISHPNAHELVL